MAKYKVRVIIKAQVEYETEVEASSEHEAEDVATGQWREKTPDDFQVSKGYITDWEADEVEQLTYDCEDCGKEFLLVPKELRSLNPDVIHPHPEYSEFCTPCGEKLLVPCGNCGEIFDHHHRSQCPSHTGTFFVPVESTAEAGA